MEVQLGEYKVPIEIIKKNNKNIYFKFKEDGVLYITCNRFVREKDILKMIEKENKSLKIIYEKSMRKYENEKKFTYLGKPYTIFYNEDVNKIIVTDSMIYAKNEKIFDKWYKEECRRVFSERIEYLINFFENIPPFSLKIRKMTTRWGVNNVTKRIITLNSELLKKDVSLIDYVIVHEICHFYEQNHSKNFWLQVEKRYPEYKLARKILRG